MPRHPDNSVPMGGCVVGDISTYARTGQDGKVINPTPPNLNDVVPFQPIDPEQERHKAEQRRLKK